MRTVRLVRYGGLGMGLLLFGQITGMAASYEFTTIDYPNALNTALVGINSSGQIVGVEWDASFPPQSSFIGASNGMLGSAFQYRGAYYTHSFGIDDAGDVIGNYIVNTAQLFEQGGFFRAADGTFNAVPSLMAYIASAAPETWPPARITAFVSISIIR